MIRELISRTPYSFSFDQNYIWNEIALWFLPLSVVFFAHISRSFQRPVVTCILPVFMYFCVSICVFFVSVFVAPRYSSNSERIIDRLSFCKNAMPVGLFNHLPPCHHLYFACVYACICAWIRTFICACIRTFISSEGALYVILPYDYQATFWTHTGP